MVVLHGGVAWWCCVVVLRGGVAWWCCMVVLHGGVAWWCCMVVLHGGVAWWCCVVVLHGGVAWWCRWWYIRMLCISAVVVWVLCGCYGGVKGVLLILCIYLMKPSIFHYGIA